MSASLFEDLENLSTKGKIAVGGLFLLGTLGLMIATSQIPLIPKTFQMWSEDTQAVTLLPQKPEEITFLYPAYFPPKTPQEERTRRTSLSSKLEVLQANLKEVGIDGNDPETIVRQSVLAGAIHPLEADALEDEIVGLRYQKLTP